MGFRLALHVSLLYTWVLRLFFMLFLICIGSELFYRFLSADVSWKAAICIGSWLQVKVSRMCYDF